MDKILEHLLESYPEIEIDFVKGFDSGVEVHVRIYHSFNQSGYGIRVPIEIKDCVRTYDELIALIKKAICEVTIDRGEMAELV